MPHNSSFLALVENAKQRIQECQLTVIQQGHVANQPFLLIDVREDHEWLQGHLPQAIHLGRGILERDIEQLVPDKKQPLVLYCGGGFRSALAADNLQQMGYQHVYSLVGGYRAWVESGGDIITP